jgi:hypothetical protein
MTPETAFPARRKGLCGAALRPALTMAASAGSGHIHGFKSLSAQR